MTQRKDLTVSIGADTRDLSRGLSRMRSAIGGLAKVGKVAGLAVAGAMTAAGVALTASTRKGLQFVDSQAKMAATLGGSIDGLRGLQIAANDAGVATGQLNKAAQQMSKRLAEAAQKGAGPAADALDQLGLSASDLLAMDVDQRFAAIADQAKKLGFDAQKTAYLLREFGVRSNEVALLIANGGDAIRAARAEVDAFGLSLSASSAAGVERANDAMSRLSLVFEGLSNQLAVRIAPVLETTANRFAALASDADGPLRSAIDSVVLAFSGLVDVLLDPAFIQAATTIGVNIVNAVTSLSGWMVTLSQNAELAGLAMIGLGAAMAFFSGPIGLAIAAVAGGIALLTKETKLGKTAAEELREAEVNLIEALATLDSSNATAAASGRELIGVHISQARAAIRAAQAEYALARAENDREQTRVDMMDVPGNFATGFDRSAAEQDAADIDTFYEEKITAAEGQLERFQKILQRFEMSRAPARTPPPAYRPAPSSPVSPAADTDTAATGEALAKSLDQLRLRLDPTLAKTRLFEQSVKVLDDALAAGTITQEEYNLRLAQMDKTAAPLPGRATAAGAGVRALSVATKEAEEEGSENFDGINAAVSNLINNIENGKDAVKNFVVELVKMYAIRGITNILGGDSWQGPIVSKNPGPKIGTNAQGTNNWRGGLTWVGERGKELVDLPRGSRVTANHDIADMMGGGGGPNITFAPTINAPGATVEAVQSIRAELNRAAQEFDARVIGAIRKGQAKRAI